jgi:DNA-binding CsgD family transcriptional regulator
MNQRSTNKHIVNLLLLLILDLFCVCQAAEFTPVVTNFTKKEYKAGNQNWAVGQDAHGYIYFGNNNGLLRFDGLTWELFTIPGNRIVRSLMTSPDGRVYVGSFEEFGYFQPQKTGEFRYHSLSQELKKYHMQNDEIWNISACNGKVYFQSFTSYFIYDGKNVVGFRMPVTFLLFNNYRNAIYTHIESVGLSRFDLAANRFNKVIYQGAPKAPVTAVLPYDANRALLVTTTDGLYLLEGNRCVRFNNEANGWLCKENANRAIITKDSVFVIGTILDGVVAIDKKGKVLWRLNSSNLLQNNTILGICCDRMNNVWLALDKGIALVHTGGKAGSVVSFQPSIGAVYGLNNYQSNIYIATNQGLYSGKMSGINDEPKNLNVSLLASVRGQVWDLERFGEQLFCGNNEETFCIDNNKLTVAAPVRGGFCIKEGVINGQDVLVQGTYTQLCIYKKNSSGKWIFSNVVENFVNPIRYLEIDYQGTIWAAHLHQGLYRIVLDRDLKHIRELKIFPMPGEKAHACINVFKVNNRVVFTNGERFYTFNDLNKEIIPFNALNDRLGKFASAYRINRFKDNYYWFIRDQEAALVRIESEKIEIIDVISYSAFPNESVDQNQNIISISDDQSLICLENGLALYRFHNRLTDKNSPFRLQLKSIHAYNTDNTTSCFVALNHPAPLPYTLNSMLFTVAYPNFDKIDNVRFRYRLDGLDKRWSDPKTVATQEYVRLPYNKYTFRVQVVSSTGEILDSLSYDFEVNPPFYLSTLAKCIYLLLVILLFIITFRKTKSELIKHRDKIEQKHIELRKKEQEQNERQIMKLAKEKLETELMLKSKELAGSTLSIIKKNDILVRIKEELIAQKEQLGSQYPKKQYEKVTRIIDESLSSEDDWTIFQSNFDRIHENFFRNLHTHYPDLTSNDLRLCAYLRLNLSSKDIANLMNISLKGVEAGRYRLRKKLNISAEKSLTEFMIEVK